MPGAPPLDLPLEMKEGVVVLSRGVLSRGAVQGSGAVRSGTVQGMLSKWAYTVRGGECCPGGVVLSITGSDIMTPPPLPMERQTLLNISTCLAPNFVCGW